MCHGARAARAPLRGARVPARAAAAPPPPAYDHEPPDPWIGRLARGSRDRQRRRFVAPRVAARTADGGGDLARLCRPPFPPHAREPVRWFHVPRCGTTFFNALSRYVCPRRASRGPARSAQAPSPAPHRRRAPPPRRRRPARAGRAAPAARCAPATRARAPSAAARGDRAAAARPDSPCCEPFFGVAQPPLRAQATHQRWCVLARAARTRERAREPRRG